MNNLNHIGIDKTAAQNLSVKLNNLLANYQIFYMNTRGFHWNIKGEKFFELHLKFEELYDDLQIKIDEIAERILTLGTTPFHSFSIYLDTAEIKPVINEHNGFNAVQHILNSFQTLIVLQRELLDLSGEADDEGTNALMSDYIREQEKLVWMYSSFLNK
ncbi:MAG: Dps family protein [Hyphomicrobiales bacterium]